MRNPAVQQALVDAGAVSSWLFDIDAAVKWGNGFTVDAEKIKENDDRLRSSGQSIIEYAWRVRRGRLISRLNEDRIVSYSDDPEYERLKDVAGGVRIFERGGV